jgi:hypothetical protein
LFEAYSPLACRPNRDRVMPVVLGGGIPLVRIGTPCSCSLARRARPPGSLTQYDVNTLLASNAELPCGERLNHEPLTHERHHRHRLRDQAAQRARQGDARSRERNRIREKWSSRSKPTAYPMPAPSNASNQWPTYSALPRLGMARSEVPISAPAGTGDHFCAGAEAPAA